MRNALLAMLLAIVPVAMGESVTALVAASTKDAVAEVAQAFTAETGAEVKLSPGGSNMLAQQIIEGAPADVFLSASIEWREAVDQHGMVADSRPLLENELVIVTGKDALVEVRSPEDLAHIEHIALAGEKVPAGIYAEQALRFHKLFD